MVAHGPVPSKPLSVLAPYSRTSWLVGLAGACLPTDRGCARGKTPAKEYFLVAGTSAAQARFLAYDHPIGHALGYGTMQVNATL